jgi:hypothetical protein
MAYWTVRARVTEVCEITVEAETAQEAQEKFDAMEWCDGSAENGEIVNWETAGVFKKDPE